MDGYATFSYWKYVYTVNKCPAYTDGCSSETLSGAYITFFQIFALMLGAAMVENMHSLFFLFSELSGHMQIDSLPDSLDYLVVPEWVEIHR